jgi:hypothetical protein
MQKNAVTNNKTHINQYDDDATSVWHHSCKIHLTKKQRD